MRNYFSFDMKGGEIFLPFVAVWAFVVIMSALAGWLIGPYTSPDTVVNSEFFVALFGGMLFFFLILSAVFILTWYFVKYTLSSISLSEERFETDYEIRPYLGKCFRGTFLTALTFGIYFPWLVVDVIRYFAAGTSFRFHPLKFRGKASTLFIYIALFVVAPTFVVSSVFASLYAGAQWWASGVLLLYGVLALLLMLSVAVYRGLSVQWFINFAYAGRKKIISTAHGWHAGVFIFGQMLLCFFTLGLYYPMAMLRIWRYYVSRMVLGEESVEDRFGFTMRPWPNYLTLLGQVILVAVTAGIYYPWAYAKIGRLLVSQTYVESEESRQPLPMPEEGD